MTSGRYILDDENNPVQCGEGHDALIAWAKWLERSENRVVGRTVVGEQDVRTDFLSLDHNFIGKGPPLLFETMVFPECEICERCSTWKQAEAQHERVVAQVRATSSKR